MIDALPTWERPATAPAPDTPLARLLRTPGPWRDEIVAAALRLDDAPVAAVGGGMGSFAMVDFLRIAGGLATSDIRVLSDLDVPWRTYEALASASQVKRDQRIRSDAASRPDNIWGFPSYAVAETLRTRSPLPLLNVLVEPVLADYYTPVLRDVLDSMQREAIRIGWAGMLRRGEVRALRPRQGGGYFAVLDPASSAATGDGTGAVAVRSRDLVISVGYPGLRFLPELRRFRAAYGSHHVVNGYEHHEHVYDALRSRPGTVLVRGSGIVASQVLDRLGRQRRAGADTMILHLVRTYVDGPHGPHPWARRRGGGGFAYQGFNYPKSVWGGQLRARMGRAGDDAELVRIYQEIGGTTTPWRRRWQRTLGVGRREGWLRSLPGTVSEFRLHGDQVLVEAVIGGRETELRVDYVIDCTGLTADIEEHPLLRDLLEHFGARRNPLGRLDVSRTFALRGADNGPGRVYVTGAAAYGGPFPGVDTFLGLQLAAQEIVDDIAARGHCRRMGPAASVSQWLKWATGRQP